MLSVDLMTQAAPSQNETPSEEAAANAVITAAVLCATAFRLRDEATLIHALRRLVVAVQLLDDA